MLTWNNVRTAGVLLGFGLIIGIGLGGAGGGCTEKTSDATIKDMPLAELRQHLKDQESSKDKDVVVVLDARSGKEFAAGHIPDARNLTLDAIPDRKDELDPRLTRYGYRVVYGNDPGSAVAMAVTKRMLGAGYSDVYLFRGGLEEWKRAGLPVITGPLKVEGTVGR